MGDKNPAMSHVTARIRAWNIRAAYARDYNPDNLDFHQLMIRPHKGLIYPNVLLRKLGTPYIVPLVCDHCGKAHAKFGIGIRLWCGECTIPEDDMVFVDVYRQQNKSFSH